MAVIRYIFMHIRYGFGGCHYCAAMRSNAILWRTKWQT